MEKRTEGAWLIHHTKKLQDVSNIHDFEDIELAGKCGILLSNLAASDEQCNLDFDVVLSIAKVSNIKKTEIETIKNVLKDAKLIDTAKDGSISVLGVTSTSVLTHTADIFNNNNPNTFQKAAIDLSENISDLPKNDKILKEYISDSHKLTNDETTELFNESEDTGLIDFEKLDDGTKIYFNGNLFRKNEIRKTNAIINSLKTEDVTKIKELDDLLAKKGCIPFNDVEIILGTQLLSKLQSIGMYDFNEVSNRTECKIFITKPSAFSKFGNPFEEDALDLAKAFVSSLYYGMNYSIRSRGKITMLKALLRKLINGYEVGPATAIGEDYRILEFKRVIQLRHDTGSMYYMKLLKKDVGELAMHVLEFGDTAEKSVIKSTMYTGSVTNYKGLEQKRFIQRKSQNKQSKKEVANLLRTLRQ